MNEKNIFQFNETFAHVVQMLQIYPANVRFCLVVQHGAEHTFKVNPTISFFHLYRFVRCKSSRTRRTSLRTELNLLEIPVGVLYSHRNVAPVVVSDFQPGISMRRESRIVDACHVVPSTRRDATRRDGAFLWSRP